MRAEASGNYTTEEAAARAYNKYLKDGVAPEPAVWGASQIKGVSWRQRENKWKAECKGRQLGYHATEEDAARACSKYLEDGIDPVKHREASTSQFTGVSWNKKDKKWKVRCKGKYLGMHTTEQAAAQAYNVQAERIGVALNAIPPGRATGASADAGAGARGGAGPKPAAPETRAAHVTDKKTKRAALRTPAAPASSKKTKL
jgi:hypothetical protein